MRSSNSKSFSITLIASCESFIFLVYELYNSRLISDDLLSFNSDNLLNINLTLFANIFLH